jgi:hypothetical protein
MQAVAIGAARAVRALRAEGVNITSDSAVRDVGSRIYQEWTSPDFAFLGASGRVSFQPNGDRDSTGVSVAFLNYNREKDSSNQKILSPVAQWTVGSGVEMTSGSVHWGHGRDGVPLDRPSNGNAADFPLYAILLVVLLLVLLIAIIAALMARLYSGNRGLSDVAYRIECSELQFRDPVVVLGTGSTGVTVSASFRGSPVALKQIVPGR